VGFSLLTPHFQLTYYLLMAAGFFWLYLVFLSGERSKESPWWQAALLFVGALGVGFAVAAIQLAPFLDYISFSPRGAAEGTSRGWAYATGWSMPPDELINVIWPAFSGILENYWGRNAFKLHSEYIGVIPLMLATFAYQLRARRRLMWFFVFLAIYGILFAFGGYTPFYRLPYHLLPGIKLTRAASMIFYLTSFSAAVLAALGAQALLGEGKTKKNTTLLAWLGVLAAAALLALVGGWQGIMDAVAAPERFGGVQANYPAFRLDALRVLVFGVVGAGLLWRRLPRPTWGLVLGLVIVVELWSVERHYIRFSPPASQLFAADEVVSLVKQDPTPGRVFANHGAYLGENYFMIHGVREVLGYSGQEIHRYDELLGGKNIWNNLLSLNENLFKVIAVEYVVLDQPVEDPRLVPATDSPVTTVGGGRALVYRYTEAAPFAYLVANALKLPDEQILPTVLDLRFDPTRLLLVPEDSPAGAAGVDGIPPPVTNVVTIEEPHAGAFRFTIDPAPAEPAYLYVAENHYPEWQATVDGAEAPVLRAQHTMMAVPVPAGAREVRLEFVPTKYAKARIVSLGVVLALLAVGVVQLIMSRKRSRADG
jgi:hypothetical protein